jgi:cytoplasmic FMR1 interacting protein
MMVMVFSDRAPGMQGGLFAEKDLKKEWEDEWKRVYKESFFYEYVLNLRRSVREMTDMSFLWFREFYLEITKCPQFPISMSLPWILTEYIVKNSMLSESFLVPFDIYNDAAQVALT